MVNAMLAFDESEEYAEGNADGKFYAYNRVMKFLILTLKIDVMARANRFPQNGDEVFDEVDDGAMTRHRQIETKFDLKPLEDVDPEPPYDDWQPVSTG
jgi:hypothetical protein